MKYINADKLLVKIKDDFEDGYDGVNATYRVRELKALIEDHEVVKVSEIQDIINKFNEAKVDEGMTIDEHYSVLGRVMRQALENLITPQPQKYGGLSVDEWEKLSKLEYVKIKYNSAGYGYFLISNAEHLRIVKLLPDPDNHIRHHSGGECPLPDNIELLIFDKGVTYTNLSKNIIWEDCTFGYRILGVSDEER